MKFNFSPRELIIITNAENLARLTMQEDPSGHDYRHILRVVKLASFISESYPKVDRFILLLSCLLHDIDDPKLEKLPSHITVNQFLNSQPLTKEQRDKIIDIIDNLSYSSSLKGALETTLEGQIAQDADRLDAIGAIGIARAFAYGGHKGRPLDDDNESQNATINHFYDKLLKLANLMNTPKAKEMAKKRTLYMKKFLTQFSDEKSLLK